MSQPADAPVELRRAVRTGVIITLLIGIGTGGYSYNDALFVAREVGTTGRLAYLVPLFGDGLILLCSTALYAAARATGSRPETPWAARIGLIIGIAVTVVMNVAAGLAHSTADALVDALAPIVFLIALEVLVYQFRLSRSGQAPDRPAQCPHPVPSSPDEAVRVDWQHRIECLREKPNYSQHGARWDIDRRRVPELVGSALNGSGDA